MVGKRYWEAARLSATIAHHWDSFEADLLLKGTDPFVLLEEIRFARFLNLARHWITRYMDEKELFRFSAQIEQPPPWEDPDVITEEAAAADADAWMAAATAGGQGIRSKM